MKRKVVQTSGGTVTIQAGGDIWVNGKKIDGEDLGNETLEIILRVEEGKLADVKCEGPLTIVGQVHGNVSCNTLTCDGIGGYVKAKTVSCDDVGQYVEANTVNCDDVAGDVKAHTVNCEKIHGSVSFGV